MCFYVRSSQGDISIEQASEFIRLKRLSSEIIANILIRNESAVPIDALEITYPRSFRESRAQSSTVEFKDISRELLNPESEHNILQHAMGEPLTWDSIGSDMVLTLKRSGNPLSGPVLPENTIDVLPGLSASEKDILHQCGLTIFVLKLKRPILPQTSIWFRVKFCPPYAVRNIETPSRRFLDWLLDETHLLYGVVGPLNVRAHALAVLNRVITECEEHRREASDAFYATGLLERLGYTGKPTRIRDWRVYVLNRNPALNNVVHDGDVLTLGPLPSLLRPSSPTRKEPRPVWVYQWASGGDHIAEPKTGGLFSINFTVRPVNYTMKLLVWITFAIAVGTLAWNISG